jgi:hypothetical protein
MPGHRIRLQWVKQGLCFDCGETRGPRGTTTRCMRHAKEHSTKQSKRNKQKRSSYKAQNRCLECGRKLSPGQTSLCEEHKNIKGYFDKNYYSKVVKK